MKFLAVLVATMSTTALAQVFAVSVVSPVPVPVHHGSNTLAQDGLCTGTCYSNAGINYCEVPGGGPLLTCGGNYGCVSCANQAVFVPTLPSAPLVCPPGSPCGGYLPPARWARGPRGGPAVYAGGRPYNYNNGNRPVYVNGGGYRDGRVNGGGRPVVVGGGPHRGGPGPVRVNGGGRHN
jgi:hypothetical protein